MRLVEGSCLLGQQILSKPGGEPLDAVILIVSPKCDVAGAKLIVGDSAAGEVPRARNSRQSGGRRILANPPMKHSFAFVIILLALIYAAAYGEAPEPASPFAPIAFLVGNWRGDLPPGPNGSKMSIELKADWSANRQGIRFDGTFLTDGKRSPYTSGIYCWNAAKHQLVFVYSDFEGSLIEGAVTVDKGALVHDFSVTHLDGKIENARAVITRKGNDAFTNDIFLDKSGSWQKVVSVEYRRVVE